MVRTRTKRIPTREDKLRIAESIFNLDSREKIQDKDSFDLDYDAYFDSNDYWIDAKNLRADIFREIRKLRPNISTERIFKKARGKDLKRDRQRTARTVLTDKEEYIKQGASKTDLKGFDTKIKREFKLLGKQKGKVKYARKTFVVVKGKNQVRFRDRKGRFTSVKT